MGMTIVVIMGGIDLSVGSIVGMSSFFVATIIVDYGMAYVGLAILVGIAIGALCGFGNGFLIAKLGLQPFLVTMGTLNLYRGITYIFSKAIAKRGLPTVWSKLWNGDIPVTIFIWCGCAILVALTIKYTKIGRYFFAIGGNEHATELSGIDTVKVKIFGYVLCGICAGIAGIMYVGRFNAADAGAGNGYELDAVAAAAIGGASLSGGRGSVIGTMLGMMVLSIVQNALTLLKIESYYQVTITGAIIIIAILMDKFSNK